MLRRLNIEMVYAANYWLNMFPRKGGVSKTLSPRALLTGQTWSYTTHCKLEFGDYVQTHEEHDDSIAARTIGAIALRPTSNTQGGYFFFSLTTGRVLNRGRWTSLPMPNEVIDRVHRMARQEHGNNGLLFEDRNHHPLVNPDDDGDDDSTYHPEEDDNSDDEEDNNHDGQDDDDDDDPGPPDNPHEGPPDHNNLPQAAEDHVAPIDPSEDEPEPDDVAENIGALPPNIQDDEHPNDNAQEQIPNDAVGQMPNTQDGHPINDIGTPTVPNDPTLSPRVRRELNRLANDGIGPTIYHG